MAVRIKDLSELISVNDENKIIVDDENFNTAKCVAASTLAGYVAGKLTTGEGVLKLTKVAGELKIEPYTSDESDAGRFYTHENDPTGVSELKFGGVLVTSGIRTNLLKMNEVEFGKIKIDNEGIYVNMMNRTGSQSVAGTIVQVSSGYNEAVELSNGYMPVGVIAQNNIPDGSPVWVQVAGYCDVLLEDNTGAARGNIIAASLSTPGRCKAYAIPTPPTGSNIELHWLRVGVAVGTVSGGIGVKVKILLKL